MKIGMVRGRAARFLVSTLAGQPAARVHASLRAAKGRYVIPTPLRGAGQQPLNPGFFCRSGLRHR